jgi:hypothetical protein
VKRTSRLAANRCIQGISNQAETGYYDPVLDYNSLPYYGNAPGIVAGTKKELFQQILTKRPENSDPDQNKKAKSALDTASRAFGRGVMTVSEGHFLMKGMARN